MIEQLTFPDFPVIDKPFKDPQFRTLPRPIWTENKAKLIERYLYYFVFIAFHGDYIDGFAGPQEPDNPEMWAAKLVLESEPKRLRKFFLCEKKKKGYTALETLKKEQPEIKGRSIQLYHGDFNQYINQILESGLIRKNDATFCLLDQRTFECQWATIKALASFEKEKFKIELFYFLGSGWLHRALSQQSDKTVIDAWWGSSDWTDLKDLPPIRIQELFCKRFKEELGYRYVTPWPIYERNDGGRVMYHMIHATDHDAAPTLMDRAYRKAVIDKESPEQFQLELDEWKEEYGEYSV